MKRGDWPAILALSVVVLVLSACGAPSRSASTSSPATSAHQSGSTSTLPGPTTSLAIVQPAIARWTTYHGDALSSGVDTSGARLDPPQMAWRSPTLDGDLFGEPLVFGSDVFAATENDTVYALSASNGTVIWSKHVGTAVSASQLPCGDVDPLVGVTGTPVIDARRGEIFVVADEQTADGGAAHHLVGLDIHTGSVELDQIVDPPGSTPFTELQRTGLALDEGRVVFGFGGNDGDCGYYHGYVVSVPETGGSESYFEVDSASGDDQGAVWMGGGSPVIDAKGNVWASAGNGSVKSSEEPYDDSDSVFELTDRMSLEQYFAPSSWASDNASDLDLGSTSPALLPDGMVLEVGKSGIGYLLRETSLGGIDGEVASTQVCPGVADGGDVVSGSVVYVPCASGVTAVAVSASPPALSVRWTTSSASSGPPILAGGLLWSIDRDATLWAIDPSNGDSAFHFSLGDEANHFPTPSVGDGQLFAPAADQVIAFSGP
ncbi:MAG: PQQ-binding-like beta-propeller repeat protein [Acidimicrobiales bacterium]